MSSPIPLSPEQSADLTAVDAEPESVLVGLGFGTGGCLRLGTSNLPIAITIIGTMVRAKAGISVHLFLSQCFDCSQLTAACDRGCAAAWIVQLVIRTF